jgi:hypothetical protein
MSKSPISFSFISTLNISNLEVPITLTNSHSTISPQGTYIFRYTVDRKSLQNNALINVKNN